MNSPIKISLYNGAYETLHDEMKAAGFEFEVTHLFSMSSPQQVFDLANSIPIASIAAVLVAWLNTKSGRKIIIKNGEKQLEIKGQFSSKELENAIEKFKEISVIESSNND